MEQRASLRNFQRGFTIVELLIVVVVIAILAAITIVAYTGIQNRAKESSVKTTLANAGKKLELYRNAPENGGAYPANVTALGLTSSANTTIGYQTVSGGGFYCVDVSIDSTRYYQTSIDAAQKQGECPTTNGLIDWWPLNGTVVNLATNETNSTAYNVTPTTGQNGTPNSAYQFDGGVSYIDTGDITAKPQFTAAVWANPVSHASYRAVLSETRDCCGSGYRGLEIKSSYSNTPSASISIWNGGNGGAANAGASVTNLNQWNFYVGTYDGSTLRFYHDGVLVNSASFSGTIGTPTHSLKIGRTGVQQSGSFVGVIDDVRIYNRALSAAEIQTLYSAGAF